MYVNNWKEKNSDEAPQSLHLPVLRVMVYYPQRAKILLPTNYPQALFHPSITHTITHKNHPKNRDPIIMIMGSVTAKSSVDISTLRAANSGSMLS